LFANFWASLLQAPLQAMGCPGLLQNPFAFALIVFLFEAFSFSDATPKQMSIFLSQNDAGIRGLSPGDATRKFLQSCRARLKFLNAGFIAGISLLSRVVDIVCMMLVGVAPNMLNLLLLVRCGVFCFFVWLTDFPSHSCIINAPNKFLAHLRLV